MARTSPPRCGGWLDPISIRRNQRRRGKISRKVKLMDVQTVCKILNNNNPPVRPGDCVSGKHQVREHTLHNLPRCRASIPSTSDRLDQGPILSDSASIARAPARYVVAGPNDQYDAHAVCEESNRRRVSVFFFMENERRNHGGDEWGTWR